MWWESVSNSSVMQQRNGKKNIVYCAIVYVYFQITTMIAQLRDDDDTEMDDDNKNKNTTNIYRIIQKYQDSKPHSTKLRDVHRYNLKMKYTHKSRHSIVQKQAV
jgi:hypothetical protein